MTSLFNPIDFGPINAANRIIMAPLTRLRAGRHDGIPNELMAQMYAQRASTGMVVAEGTYPTIEGRTWYGQPGIETTAQQEGWAKVTEAVHAEGGKIVLQIMHGGRVGHPEITTTGRTVGPSALASPDPVRVDDGKVDAPVPHALTLEEIEQITQAFVAASRRAIDAGFDAAQIHCANGYLLNQFLAPGSNQRDDQYAGTPENHARLPVEVITAVAEEIGGERVGLRISPEQSRLGATESDPEFTRTTYLALAKAIAPLGLNHVDILHEDPRSELVQEIRAALKAPFIANTGWPYYTPVGESRELVEGGFADAVSVGRPIIANPDLVRRWQENLELNEADESTFYVGGASGYTDYPFYQD